MKYLTILFIALFSLPNLSSAQSDTDYSEWLSVGIYMPEDEYDDILTPEQLRRLQTKVISIISKNGTTAKISAFRLRIDSTAQLKQEMMSLMAKGVVCTPKFEIYDTREVDTGMKRMKVVDVNLTLTIQYVFEDIIFSDHTVQLQGSGNTPEQAINSAIRNIKTSDGHWKRFLDQTHSEIVRYYDGMCAKLMDQARQLYKINLTHEALTILWPIPKEVNCHSDVEELTITIYQKHINEQCKKHLLTARTYLASNSYTQGLETLRRIDPTSECIDDVYKLLEQIDKEKDERDDKDRALELQMQKQWAEKEKFRYQNIERIAAQNNQKQFATVFSTH
ncbi:MAG: hypothetical protein AAGI23_08050 [Bacteroidota bacterium]